MCQVEACQMPSLPCSPCRSATRRPSRSPPPCSSAASAMPALTSSPADSSPSKDYCGAFGEVARDAEPTSSTTVCQYYMMRHDTHGYMLLARSSSAARLSTIASAGQAELRVPASPPASRTCFTDLLHGLHAHRSR